MSGNAEKNIIKPFCECGMYFVDSKGRDYYPAFWYLFDADGDIVAWYILNESSIYGSEEDKLPCNAHVSEIWIDEKKDPNESIIELVSHISSISCAKCGNTLFLEDQKTHDILYLFSTAMRRNGFTIRRFGNKIWKIGDDIYDR